MAQKWARSWGGRDTRSFGKSGQNPDFSQKTSRHLWKTPHWHWLVEKQSIGLCWSALTWFWLILKPFFFGPTFFVRPLHGFGHFGWKHLGGSSKVSELDLMLGEPQSCNFLHEYPKLMWKGDRHKESDLSYFEKIQKKIFLRFGSPKIVKFWDSCKLV